MFLNGFIQVSDSQTVGGQPIDAFQADAMRQNDLFFEKKIQALLCSPWASTGVDGAQPSPSASQFLHATTIDVNAQVEAVPGVPIVWFATESIRIRHLVNARGRGAAGGENGDFGGAGGAGAVAGFRPLLPVTNQPLIALPANKDLTAVGSPTDLSGSPLATRVLSMIGICRGGAAGGGTAAAPAAAFQAGGAGGGVVILCAPLIEFLPPTPGLPAGPVIGQIDARGADAGAATAGGGGGGMVILIAKQINGLTEIGAGKNILLDGGNASPVSARTGGHGALLKQRIL